MASILDEEFVDTKTVTRDARGRVAIGTEEAAKTYNVSKNAHGQILLTPVVLVPQHEAWLLKNPEAMDSVRRGLADAAAGRVHDMGSFAEFANAEIDD
jgi:hypothetical protein